MAPRAKVKVAPPMPQPGNNARKRQRQQQDKEVEADAKPLEEQEEERTMWSKRMRHDEEEKEQEPDCTIVDSCTDVLVYSIGWDTQNVPFNHNPQTRIHQKNGLADRMRVRFNGLKPDVWADCSEFNDRVAWGHCGENVAQLRAIVDSRPFPNWLEKVKWDFETACSDGRKTVVVVTVCKAGVNRSPGAAALLAAIFDGLGYRTKVRHLSQGIWEQRRICSTCYDCSPDHEDAIAAKRKACLMWNRL